MPIVIPYTKQTWVDGSGGGTPVSAARLGVVEEGILDVSQAPAVGVYHNAAQSIPTGAVTALAFNSERFDQAGGVAATHHDNVTNNSRLACLYAGIYLIDISYEWAASNAGTVRDVNLRLNGATTIATDRKLPVATVTQNGGISRIYQLAVNDYIEVAVYQDTGAGLNMNATGNRSPEFTMIRIA